MTQLRVEDLADTGHNLLQSRHKPAMMDAELDTVRAQLEEVERRLIPLLITVQRALGKEPSVSTRDKQRAR